MSEWIISGEKKPTVHSKTGISDNVIGWCGGSLGVFCYGEIDGEYYGWSRAYYCNSLADADCEYDDEYEVTHWMPLPEPPK
jgi:hypothetical protein